MQLFLFFESISPQSRKQSVQIIQSCMKDIDEWITINKLKLNKSRTELIVIGSQHRPKTEIEALTLGSNDASCDVYSSSAAQNIFDEKFRFKISKWQLFARRHFFTFDKLLVFEDFCLMKV